MKNRRARWRALLGRVDWVVVGIVTGLSIIGILNLSTAAEAGGTGLEWSQTVWFIVGIGVAVGTCFVDYRLFERTAYLIYLVVLVLLGVVLVVGTELNGARRWLDFGPFMVQPSELLKVATILVTARYFHDQSQPEAFSLRELALPGLLVGGALFLVVRQPDLGTALVILILFFSMVLFEGLSRGSLFTVLLAGFVAVPLGWNFGMHDYQKKRLLAFVGLEEARYGASWQVRQSKIAIGSGRFWGKGHGEGTQVDKGFVPEQENDFIAANWGEERGFFGMFVLVVLYAGLILRALEISRRAENPFGAHVGVGVAALIFWHVVLNLGMVTGLVPVVGLTLPFLSYGGSSLLTTFFAVGLLLNVGMRRRSLSSSR